MKLFKNISQLWSNDWLLDNVRSNMLNIIIGLDISLLVNLFTGSTKNSQIWFAIGCYSFSVLFLLITLLRRDKLEKDKKSYIKDNPTRHISDVIDEFLNKNKSEFRKFKLYLLAFIITIIFGILLTYWGNNRIASEENKNITAFSDSLVEAKTFQQKLTFRIDSLDILLRQYIKSDTLYKTKKIIRNANHGR